MKKIILTIVSLMLISCSDNKEYGIIKTSKFILQSEISTKHKTPIHNSTGGFAQAINLGERITFINDVDQFSIEYLADYPKENPIFMSSMSINKNAGCRPPSLVGIYNPTVIDDKTNNIYTIRGKADYADIMKGDYDHAHEPTCIGGYAFCSQKDGKQVTICISQKTDNPKLANEIFDSFRWLSTDEQHDQP